MKLKIFDVYEEIYVSIDQKLDLKFLNKGDTIIIDKCHFVITYKIYDVINDTLSFSVVDNHKYTM